MQREKMIEADETAKSEELFRDSLIWKFIDTVIFFPNIIVKLIIKHLKL